MDDLSAKLGGILSDPEAMKEIAQLASSLGIESPGVHKEPPPADKGTAAMLSSLTPLLGSLKEEDDTTRLLDAIRPFLSDERREKLDKAKKLMRLMRLLPMLRGLDLFDL
jgi:hypothetical protein